MKKINFAVFVKDLITNPKQIFTTYFTNESHTPPFIIILIFIYGVGKAIDKFDEMFVKYDLKGNLQQLELLNSWWAYWLMAIVFGTMGGFISYYIGGWVFNLRIKWSKGETNIEQSRNIFLYSRSIYSIALILVGVINTALLSKPYDPNSIFTAWDLASIIIVITFLYHSAYIGYTGVITLTNANKTRSRIWFLFIPMTLFLFAFTALIIAFNKMGLY